MSGEAAESSFGALMKAALGPPAPVDGVWTHTWTGPEPDEDGVWPEPSDPYTVESGTE